MTFAEIQAKIYTWVATKSELPDGQVIFANQGEHRPPRPYASINVSSGTRKGGGTDELRTEGSTFIVAGLRSMTITLNVFGDDALETLSKVRDSLDMPSVVEFFAEDDLAVLDATDVRDLTEFEGTKYLQRAQMDLTLGYSFNQVDSATTHIEDVVLNGQLIDT